METKPISIKQIDLIQKLDKSYNEESLKKLSSKEASGVIEVLLSDKQEFKEIQESSPFNEITYGLATKLVYQKCTRNNINPLEQEENFKKEVEATYKLFLR